MGEPLANVESSLSQQPRGLQRRGRDRNDLVVVTVQDEGRLADLLQVFGEVRLREGLDSEVLSLRAAHHGLTPPVLDHAPQRLRARSVVAVEGTAGEVQVELRAVGGKLLP